MTDAEIAITTGYNAVLTHLREQFDSYMKDARENPEDFSEIEPNDVICWLIESF